MKRSLFALFAILLLLCSCGNTANNFVSSPKQPVSADELSADRVFYGGYNLRMDDDNIYICDYDNILATIEDARYVTIDRSLDGKAMALAVTPTGINDRDPDFRGYSIYYYKDELIHIADEATGPNISDDGSKVTYIKNIDYSLLFSQDGEVLSDIDAYTKSYCDLYLWDGKESTFIVNNQLRCADWFSPDSKDLYYSLAEDENEYYDWYLYNDGEAVLVTENATLLRVSNNCEYFFGYDKNDEFFVQKGIDDNRQFLVLYDDIDYYSIEYSADHSQVTYNTEDGFYISVDGGEAKRLSEPKKELLLPELTNFPTDFSGQFYLSDMNVIYKITEDYEALPIVEYVDEAYIANDGKTITASVGEYITTSIMTINGDNPTESTVFDLVDNNIVRFYVSYDGKTVYFSNNDGELFARKDGKNILIDTHDDFDDSYPPFVVYDNDKFYYIYDDSNKLMCYDGEELKEVMRFPKDIDYISRWQGYLDVEFDEYSRYFFYTKDDYLTNKGGILT
ncbi:MAG: hypothetical protein LBM41_04980 [Ruminococcus sp.]|jgi:hypothetical protein|nr:hypothetical protein [Ruminococcus sp.]